jgi:hypothetical protein
MNYIQSFNFLFQYFVTSSKVHTLSLASVLRAADAETEKALINICWAQTPGKTFQIERVALASFDPADHQDVAKINAWWVNKLEDGNENLDADWIKATRTLHMVTGVPGRLI